MLFDEMVDQLDCRSDFCEYGPDRFPDREEMTGIIPITSMLVFCRNSEVTGYKQELA